jgi:hypothetical protein
VHAWPFAVSSKVELALHQLFIQFIHLNHFNEIEQHMVGSSTTTASITWSNGIQIPASCSKFCTEQVTARKEMRPGGERENSSVMPEAAKEKQ